MQKNAVYQKLRELFIKIWQSTQRIITTGPSRRYRAWLFQAYVLLALLAFSFLAVVVSAATYLDFDLEITRELQSETPTWIGTLLRWVSWPGYALPSVTIIALVVVFLSFAGLRWEAAAALITAIIAGGINYLLKVAIRRPRPSEDLVEVFQVINNYSFPSGHVMFYTAFFGFLLFLTFSMLNRPLQRSALIFLFASLIALVGLSRMYLGEHWASDVIAGYLMGSLALILSIQIYRQGKSRFFTDQPVAPAEWEDVHISDLDPNIISLGAKANEYDPDRPQSRSPFRGSAKTYPVPQTGGEADRDRESRRNGSGPPRD